MKRQILSILLTFCMVLALLPTVALAEEAGGSPTLLNSESIKGYLNDDGLPAGSYQLERDVEIEQTLKISGEVTLDLNGKTLKKTGEDGRVIQIESGGNLTLQDNSEKKNGTIEGGKAASGGGVGVSGTFTMTGGTIQNCEAIASNFSGGGVCVFSSGIFTMEGGTIKGCKAKNGGGVYVYAKGTFNMKDGSTIEGCTIAATSRDTYAGGGGVYAKGTFNMTGGTIKGCTVTATGSESAHGGGVYVYSTGRFNMAGGTIDGCTVTNGVGGGVFVSPSGGTFNMTGGIIQGCTAAKGGGVFVAASGTFTMASGNIEKCTATWDGGGVFVQSRGTFTMTGGTIKGCTAKNGGGVHVAEDGTFSMTETGGTIQSCTAKAEPGFPAYGGGVYAKGKFTMASGTIDGCQATAEKVQSAYGGGVYVNEDGTFIMQGGTIQSCTATATEGDSVHGGGIYNNGTTALSGNAKIQGCRVENAPSIKKELGGGIYSASFAKKITIQGNVMVSGCSGSVNGKSDAMYLGTGSSISGGTFDSSVTNGGTIGGGTFSGAVTNNGTINSGNFTGGVTNNRNGKINGGTFTKITNKSSEKIDTTKVNCNNIIEEGGSKPSETQKVTVTFDAKGGSDVAEQKIDPNGTAAMPENPTKANYTFGGWYTNYDCTTGNEYNFKTPVTENITLYAKWTANTTSGGTSGGSSGSGSSGSGSSGSHSSSGSSSSKNSYSVSATTGKTQNGSASVSSKNATAGERVTITVHPEKGYTLDKLSVLDKNGKEIKLKDNGDGTFTFTMPASKVDIQPVFKEAVSEPAPPTVENNQSAKPKKTVLQMQVGSKQLISNGEVSTKNAAPIIRNDRTLVPIRFITEALGGDVKWNEKIKEVILVIDGKEIKMEIGKSLEKYNVAPILVNDRTYVPVRFVADELQATVSWLDATKTVTIVKDAVEK